MIKVDVLIIGGGFAGVSAAQELEKNGIATLLVDKKDYFEVTFATLRNAAAPSITNNDARKQYKHFLSGSFKQASVETLNNQTAILADGTHVQFKTAIIASGSRYPTMPIAKSNSALSINLRNEEMLKYHQQIQSANKILVIGGGVVGVELAGEIAYAFPQKHTILAHNTDALLDGFKSKTRTIALKQLKNLGVNIELNANYRNVDGVYIEQNSKQVADADLVLPAVGTLPNSEFLQPQLAHILNSKGFVKVNQQLEVLGESNLYALGDVADVGEAKLGYLAQQQGTYVAKSIARKLKTKPVKAYKRNPLMALIPTGQKSGVVQLPFAVTTLKPLLNMKQKDLFINKIYNAFGTSASS